LETFKNTVLIIYDLRYNCIFRTFVLDMSIILQRLTHFLVVLSVYTLALNWILMNLLNFHPYFAYNKIWLHVCYSRSEKWFIVQKTLLTIQFNSIHFYLRANLTARRPITKYARETTKIL
jgi:hypothetical protein